MERLGRALTLESLMQSLSSINFTCQTLEEIIDKIGQKEVISKLDLSKGLPGPYGSSRQP